MTEILLKDIKSHVIHSYKLKYVTRYSFVIFSSPGRSPGRGIVLPPASALALGLAAASALAKSLTLKFFM